jgi:hypothetical protein
VMIADSSDRMQKIVGGKLRLYKRCTLFVFVFLLLHTKLPIYGDTIEPI